MSISIDVSSFHLYNIMDTCAIWNILSSTRLFSSAIQAKVEFICTHVVRYECLLKPRKEVTKEDDELKARFLQAQKMKQITIYSLDITDLQTISILEKRKRLGKGELASIAYASKINQSILTDDQKARKLAQSVFSKLKVQTTPHLLGWLFFKNILRDGDNSIIISEHKQLNRPLGNCFEIMYAEACRCRLMASQNN